MTIGTVLKIQIIMEQIKCKLNTYDAQLETILLIDSLLVLIVLLNWQKFIFKTGQ